MMTLQHRLLALATTLMMANTAWSSALFDDQAANLWLVDTDSGQMTSYSFGDWLADYQSAQSQVTLPAGFQALVNELPNSSTPMSASQPGVSVIGLSKATYTLGEDSGPALLDVTPRSGFFSDTIGVSLLVEPRQLDAGERSLWWRLNGGDWQSRDLDQKDRDAAGRGYIEQRLYLVREASAGAPHELEVELRDGASVLARQTRQYTLQSDHADGELRDTDEDGLPDLVEQAIGLNPLTSDLDEPSHLKNWTRFDLWLRCDEDELAKCAEPADADEDGWTDLDEQWRGTRHDDEKKLTFNDAPEPESEAKRQLIRHYKEFPSARRLYEIEYRLAADPMALTPDRLTAATLYGATGWQLSDLVTQADLENASLSPAQVAPGRLLDPAEQALANGEWPIIRLPAGDAALIRASQVESVGDPADEATARRESLLYLAPQQDLMPSSFNVNDFGSWTTADEWRTHYRTWLQTALVQPVSPQFDDAVTRPLLAFEYLLTEEARLRDIGASFKLGVPDAPLAWLEDLRSALEFRSPGVTLSDLIEGLNLALQPGALLADDASQIDQWLSDLPDNSNSQSWLAEKMAFSQAGTDIGCFISQSEWDNLNSAGNEDLLQLFQDDCPLHHTSTDLANWQQDSLDRRYRLRLMLLANGATRLDNDASLALASNDSDGDDLTNNAEIMLRPYRWHTLPWLMDTDTDSYADGNDICPLDRYNRCNGVPEENRLFVGSDLTVSKPLNEGTVLLSLQLDRPAERPVTIDYQVWAGPNDNGVDGEDFIADSGQVVIQPGQTTVLIPVTLLGGGSGDQFRLEVTGVEGANLGSTAVTRVELTDYVAQPPVANVMASNLSVNEMQSLTLDASLSYDPAGSPLSFNWATNPGLGETLTPSATAGMAELTAPNLAGNEALYVTVTVTNEALLSDQKEITVMILAEDEPPTLLGTPLYEMVSQSTLTIPLSELDAYVEDPEGAPVSFDTVLAQPEGVLAYLTGTDLVLEGDTITVEAVGQLGVQQGSALTWRDTGFAYLTNSTATEPARLYGWHPDTGLQVLYTAAVDESLSSLMYDAALDRFYFDRQLNGNRTFSWLDDGAPIEGVAIDSVWGGAYTRQINSRAEGVYLCTSDTALRVFIDTINSSALVTDTPCTLSDQSVQTSRQTCLQSASTLWCTAPDSSDPALVQPLSLENLALVTLDAVGDALVMMFEDPELNVTSFWYLTPGVSGEQLADWPQLDLRHNLVVSGQTATLAVGFDQLELYRWQPGEPLQQFNSPYVIDSALSWYQLPTFVNGDEVLGLVPQDASNYRVYRLDLATDTFDTLIELGPGSTPIEASGYDLLQSARGLSVGTEYGDGECYWQPLTEAGTLGDAYLERAACNDRLATPSVEIHRDYNDPLGRYFRVSGSEFVGQTLLQLDVSDETGNNTVMPIELNVVEGP